MTATEFDFYVIDTILDFVSNYGVCEIDFDVAQIHHEARDDYQNWVSSADDEKLKQSIGSFSEAYSYWDDCISAEIKSYGKATIEGKQVVVGEAALSNNANHFLHRFIIAILQAKFGNELTVL